jgi:hypothetical protein
MSQVRRFKLCIGVLLSAVLLVVVVAVSSAAARAPTASCSWRAMPIERPEGSWLNSVVVISPNDAWAVGGQGSSREPRPLIERWDGHAWRTVDAAHDSGELKAVAGTSADDVWAVGAAARPARFPPIIEHWDGRRWATVESPDRVGVLLDVAVFPQSVIAVRDAVSINDTVTRWDGESWSAVWSGAAVIPFVQAIAAHGDDDNVWVVAGHRAYHWNGVRWTYDDLLGLVLRDKGSASGGWLHEVATAGDTVWAVGQLNESRAKASNITYGLVFRRDGNRWRLVYVRPNMVVSAVDAVSPHDVWTLAYSPARGMDWDPSGVVGPPLLLHWNGKKWGQVARPKILVGTQLVGLAAPSATDVWAVGRSKASKTAFAVRYTCAP